ncbi:hypothetical protein [Edwardsiella tarda]|uniref:hypothetical protein n=1 Tax=Edwardsiella tarda TaxID=636 RepID=UPI0020A2B540|nr:hypothetical protein [Edwardsiella tarda]
MLRRLSRLTAPLAVTLGLVVPLCDAATTSAPLQQAIQAYFQQQFPGETYQVQVRILSEAEQWPHCLQPQISQLASPRRWGVSAYWCSAPMSAAISKPRCRSLGAIPLPSRR